MQWRADSFDKKLKQSICGKCWVLDVMPCPVMAMSCYANGEISDEQVSLRGTVIIIANHGERIDIPAGESQLL